MEKNLEYWKKNAEEDYLRVPISVLRYITELELAIKNEENTSLHECKYCGVMTTQDDEECYMRNNVSDNESNEASH